MMEMSTIAKQHEEQRHLEANGLYSSQFEKDACGMGFVVNIKGKKVPRYYRRWLAYS